MVTNTLAYHSVWDKHASLWHSSSIYWIISTNNRKNENQWQCQWQWQTL